MSRGGKEERGERRQETGEKRRVEKGKEVRDEREVRKGLTWGYVAPRSLLACRKQGRREGP